MSVSTVTCYLLKCDECSAPYQPFHIDDYIPHHTSEAEARAESENADWIVTADGRDICYDCVTAGWEPQNLTPLYDPIDELPTLNLEPVRRVAP